MGYLVLSRRRDQKIILTHKDGTRMEVVVVEVRGDKVRLGVKAPLEWDVHREEVMAAIDAGEGRRRA